VFGVIKGRSPAFWPGGIRNIYLAFLAVVCLVTAVRVQAGGLCISEPAGFIRTELAPASSVLVSFPFVPFDGSLEAVFFNQLIAGSRAATADCVVQWDATKQEFVASFKESRDGGAVWRRADGGVSTQMLRVGEGFWIDNRHDAQSVFLGGRIPLVDSQLVVFVEGLNVFSYPFPSSLLLAHTDLWKWSAAGDQILDSGLSRHEAEWRDVQGLVSNLRFGIGQGFWYRRATADPLSWTEVRPYTNLFFPGAGVPSIDNLAVTSNRSELVLNIGCSGAPGELLEVFYKDMAVTSRFVSESGWLVADENLASQGRLSMTWMDRGSCTRVAVTSVFSRVYVVARQDIDRDGNGISDARELLMAHAESSGIDRLMHYGKSSGPGLSQPKALDGSLIWYADSALGQDGYDGFSPTVADGHGPKRTLQSAVAVAESGGQVRMAEGAFGAGTLNPASKTVKLVPMGRVVIR
jgi:hypothetical protein